MSVTPVTPVDPPGDAPPPTSRPTSPPTSPPDEPDLPDTGVPGLFWAVAAAGALALGGLLVNGARRRRGTGLV